MHTHTHTHMHICMHASMHTHTHTYAHTHTHGHAVTNLLEVGDRGAVIAEIHHSCYSLPHSVLVLSQGETCHNPLAVPQVPASDAGHDTTHGQAGEKTRGEEMLEAYRARQMEAQRSQSSVSADGQPRSRIPVRGPPPNYQAALRSKQQDLGTAPQSLQGGRGQQTVSCSAVHHIGLQCSTVHHITLQGITLQYSALHHTAGHHIAAHHIAAQCNHITLQYIAVQCTMTQCTTSHCSTVHHITLQRITLQCTTSHCSTVHHSTEQHSTEQVSIAQNEVSIAQNRSA